MELNLPNKPLVLKPLPFSYDALEPVLSAEAVKVHYEGHHAGYVDKYNQLLKTGGSEENLEFNFSGYVLHSLLWNNLASPGSYKPGPKLISVLGAVSPRELIREMITQGNAVKGSGWTLLLETDDDVFIENIPNHELRRVVDYKPILILDIWEHAYYLDYLNKRGDYLDSIFACINWETVESRLSN